MLIDVDSGRVSQCCVGVTVKGVGSEVTFVVGDGARLQWLA